MNYPMLAFVVSILGQAIVDTYVLGATGIRKHIWQTILTTTTKKDLVTKGYNKSVNQTMHCNTIYTGYAENCMSFGHSYGFIKKEIKKKKKRWDGKQK